MGVHFVAINVGYVSNDYIGTTGGAVVLDMNGVVSVFHSIFAAVREKDVTLCLDMGCGIAWSVNGMDVTTETTGDTNFSVKADVGAIPEGLIEETAGGFTVKWAEKTMRRNSSPQGR